MIAKIIHQIWLGKMSLPSHFKPWMTSWKHYFPQWEYRLWTDSDVLDLLPDLMCPQILEGNQNLALKSDVLRLELLRKFGGLYVDCDFESLEPMEHLFQSDCFHYGDELQGRPSNAWMCSSQNHKIPTLMLDQLRHGVIGHVDTAKGWHVVVQRTGPEALARALNYWVGEWKGETLYHRGTAVGVIYPGKVTAFWQEILYPYFYKHANWKGFVREQYPLAMAAHHWAGSWK